MGTDHSPDEVHNALHDDLWYAAQFLRHIYDPASQKKFDHPWPEIDHNDPNTRATVILLLSILVRLERNTVNIVDLQSYFEEVKAMLEEVRNATINLKVAIEILGTGVGEALDDVVIAVDTASTENVGALEDIDVDVTVIVEDTNDPNSES